MSSGLIFGAVLLISFVVIVLVMRPSSSERVTVNGARNSTRGSTRRWRAVTPSHGAFEILLTRPRLVAE